MATTAQTNPRTQTVRQTAMPETPDNPITAARPGRTVVAAARTSARPPLFEHARRVTTHAPQPDVPAAGTAVPTRPTPGAGRGSATPPVLRITCWQLALVLAFVAVGRTWPAATALGVAAAALLALTAVRVRGTWLSTVLARRVRLLLRRRSHRLPAAADGPAALLALLVPGARIGTADIGGQRAGVVSQPDGLIAVLRPVHASPGDVTRAALSGALLPDADEEAPRLGLHLVLHRGPQQPHPRVWLTVRALRDVDAVDDEALRVTLGNAVRRMGRRVRRTNLDLIALSDREVLATLTALTHTGPDRGTFREDWRYWHAGPVTQVGMRLSGLGTRSPDRAATLERVLASAREVALTVAVAADVPDLTGVVRIAATTAEAADAAADRLASLGPDLGVYLERLDGLHGRAVTASFPIGGNLS
jgi:hypothetical protein